MQCVRCLTENVEIDLSAKTKFVNHDVWYCKNCGINWESEKPVSFLTEQKSEIKTHSFHISVEPTTNIVLTANEIQERWFAINSKPLADVRAEEVEFLAYAVLELQAALQLKNV